MKSSALLVQWLLFDRIFALSSTPITVTIRVCAVNVLDGLLVRLHGVCVAVERLGIWMLLGLAATSTDPTDEHSFLCIECVEKVK